MVLSLASLFDRRALHFLQAQDRNSSDGRRLAQKHNDAIHECFYPK